MSIAIIALGTNLGDREKNLNDAVDSLSRLIGVKVLRRSTIIETEPWGVTDQPCFLNMAVMVETEVAPHVLLGECLGIEAAMGRLRGIKYGPRIIDLDLICYENFTCNDKDLVLPHPLAKERDFVMIPLKELGADIDKISGLT